MAAVGLVLLAALVYGDHVLRGGLLWDDWENGATSRYHYEPGFLGPFDLRQAAYRPLLALLLPLPHLLFGDHAAPHLALALVLAVAAATSFHALLRALGAAREFALGAAALALVFPWSDSTRLWATASINLVAVALVLGAAAVSVRAVRDAAPLRHMWATAAAFAAAILTYEAVAGVVLLLPLLYGRSGWRRWRTEAAIAGAACILVAAATTKPSGGTGHIVAMGRDGIALLARSLEPWGVMPPAVALAAAGIAVLVRRSAARPALVSLAALVLAWAPFAPGEAKYVPTATGVYDRVNIVAGFAIAALVCSLAALVRGPLGRVALIVVIGCGWVVHARKNVTEYERAAAVRSAELEAIARAAPHPARGTVIVAFHGSDWAAPGIPVFARDWDLGGALKLRYGDASIGGYPVGPGRAPTCGRKSLLAADASASTPYTRALLVDVTRGDARRVSDQGSCRAAVTAFSSGG